MKHTVSALSLYIHFPFCISKCRYCDFYSIPFDTSLAHTFIEALKREWDRVCEEHSLRGARIQTIYCGGGTPSILTPHQWSSFARLLIHGLDTAPDLEWSVECNPESFDPDKARSWLDSGVNRLTLGVQSLDDRMLRFLGRPHTARQALDALSEPILGRFGSVGVDIMYGLAGQTLESLGATLDTVLAYEVVRHLSAYEVTLSDKTPLGRHRRLLPLPSEETLSDMMQLVCDTAGRSGFKRYEVSNWAKPSHRCRHNMVYWTHEPYVGLGPSAHSFLPPLRFANVADTQGYIEALERGRSPHAFAESLNSDSLASEMIFLGLRTAEGVNEDRFREMTGREFRDPSRNTTLQSLADEGFLVHSPPHWRPTARGMMMADGIASKLL